jgi:hypothetical protein
VSTALPEVDQFVGIVPEGSRDVLSSRVEEIGAGWVALSPPSSPDSEQELAEGMEIELQWITPRGLGIAKAILRRTSVSENAGVVAELTGDAELVQRRDHVRTDALVRLAIKPLEPHPDKQPSIGATLDLAGGGLRARVPRWLEENELVHVRVLLDDEEIAALARVVRRIDDDTVALSFEHIPMSERERIVRHVFKRLRKALAARES